MQKQFFKYGNKQKSFFSVRKNNAFHEKRQNRHRRHDSWSQWVERHRGQASICVHPSLSHSFLSPTFLLQDVVRLTFRALNDLVKVVD